MQLSAIDAAIQNRTKGCMSWLSWLEEYAARYENQLRARGFYRINSFDGPGMGAAIEYANKEFDIELVNDRGQFMIVFLNATFSSRIKAGFLFRSRTRFPAERIDFNFILAALRAAQSGRDFTELNFQEKSALFHEGYDLEDPFGDFFANLDAIIEMLRDNGTAKVKRWIESWHRDWEEDNRQKQRRSKFF
jgi:hypothetical protein